MERDLFLLVLVSIIAAAASQAQTDCTQPIKSSSGDTYNIAALNGVTVQANVGTTGYKITICTNGIEYAFSNKCGLCDNAGYCEVEQWYDNCVGKFASATGMHMVANGQGVELAYPNGEFGRAGVVQILCVPGAGNADNVRIQNDGNLALIDSGLACSGLGGKVSPGGIILIIILCLAFVYLVGGAVFMRFVRGAEIGPDLIPNKEFWVIIPGLVIEGALFLVGTVKGLIGRISGNS